MSDHVTGREIKKTHHIFVSGVIELFLEFLHLFLHTRSIQQFLELFGAEVRHKTVLLAKYEAHHSIMSPFAYVVDQVPEYDW